MPARILVAFVDLQHRPGSTVEKRRQERRPALADATRPLEAPLRKANLWLAASCDDGAQAIENKVRANAGILAAALMDGGKEDEEDED